MVMWIMGGSWKPPLPPPFPLPLSWAPTMVTDASSAVARNSFVKRINLSLQFDFLDLCQRNEVTKVFQVDRHDTRWGGPGLLFGYAAGSRQKTIGRPTVQRGARQRRPKAGMIAPPRLARFRSGNGGRFSAGT